jgi:hypothetical protein
MFILDGWRHVETLCAFYNEYSLSPRSLTSNVKQTKQMLLYVPQILNPFQ